MSRMPGWGKALAVSGLVPLTAFAIARLILSLAAVRSGFDPIAPATWCRGDSGLYLSIAIRGYRVFPCPEDAGRENPRWCGNTSWLPAYPALIAVLRRAGLPVRRGAVAISAVFSLLVLSLLWFRGFVGLPRQQALIALGIAALFPGHVYDHAAFPLSMFAFFVLLSLLALERGALLAGALAAAAAAFTYTPGVMLAVAVLYAGLIGSGSKPAWARWTAAASGAGVVAAGLAAVLAIQRYQTGTWQAFALNQSSYGYERRWPWQTLFAQLAPIFDPRAAFERRALGLNSLMVAILIGAAVVAAIVQRPPAVRRVRLVALAVLPMWILPLIVTEELRDLPRREAALLPVVLIVPLLPRPLQWLLLIGAVPLSYAIARLFFESRLV